MLKLFRKKGVMKKILWVLAVVIILSFGVFGTANYLNRRSVDYAGKIFGKKVSFDEFHLSFLHARNQAILVYGDNFYKIRPLLNLDAETWDRLILLYEARKRKIKVNDEDVVRAISEMKFFQNNGRFDKTVYDLILNRVFQCTGRDFEEGVRETLLFAKLYEQETAPLVVSEDEVRQKYQEITQKVQVDFIPFFADDYKNKIALEPKDIEQYFQEHKSAFRAPPSINLEYLSLVFADNATEEQKTQTEDQAMSIADELAQDPDFTKIAQKYNLTVKESGLFSEEEPMKSGLPIDILRRAFELQDNEISEPLKTSGGYYILRLKEKKESYIPELNQVLSKVKDALTRDKAKQLAQSAAQETLTKIREQLASNPQGDFSSIAKNLSLSVSQTQFFSRGEYIEKVGISKEFQDAAFGLSEKSKISDVIEIPKGYAILCFKNSTPIDEKEFEKEKDKLRDILTAQKKSQAFSEFITQLRAKANLEDNVSRLRKETEKTPPPPPEEY